MDPLEHMKQVMDLGFRLGAGLPAGQPACAPCAVALEALEQAAILIEDERQHPGCHGPLDWSAVSGKLWNAINRVRSGR